MKKKFLIFLFVLSCVVLTNFVYAYQIEDYLKIDNIDDLENAYLVNHGAKSRIELSTEENKELSLLIQSHKDHAYGVTPVAEAIRLDIIQEEFSLIMILALLHGFMAMQQ